MFKKQGLEPFLLKGVNLWNSFTVELNNRSIFHFKRHLKNVVINKFEGYDGDKPKGTYVLYVQYTYCKVHGYT